MYDPREAALQLGDITVDIHMVTWAWPLALGMLKPNPIRTFQQDHALRAKQNSGKFEL